MNFRKRVFSSKTGMLWKGFGRLGRCHDKMAANEASAAAATSETMTNSPNVLPSIVEVDVSVEIKGDQGKKTVNYETDETTVCSVDSPNDENKENIKPSLLSSPVRKVYKRGKGTFSKRLRKPALLMEEDNVPSSTMFLSPVLKSRVKPETPPTNNNKDINGEVQSNETYQIKETQESRDDTETQRCSIDMPPQSSTQTPVRKRKANSAYTAASPDLDHMRQFFEQLDRTSLTLESDNGLVSPSQSRPITRTCRHSSTSLDTRMTRLYQTYQASSLDAGVQPRSYAHFVKHRYEYLAGNKDRKIIYNGFLDV
jgi:hypothetical protein